MTNHSQLAGHVLPGVRAQIAEIVAELTRIECQVFNIAQSLPLPPDTESVLDGRLHGDAVTELFGTLRAVHACALPEIVARLRAAMYTTDADLRFEAWEPAEAKTRTLRDGGTEPEAATKPVRRSGNGHRKNGTATD